VTARRGEQLDPITFELLSAALHAAAVEMGGVLKHSSYSPIIREMDDFSCAIFRADGDLVAQADFIPAQLGAMSLVVKAIIERWGGQAVPGDAFLANHPYLGAMHTPDLNVIMPVFTGRKLFGWRPQTPEETGADEVMGPPPVSVPSNGHTRSRAEAAE